MSRQLYYSKVPVQDSLHKTLVLRDKLNWPKSDEDSFYLSQKNHLLLVRNQESAFIHPYVRSIAYDDF